MTDRRRKLGVYGSVFCYASVLCFSAAFVLREMRLPYQPTVAVGLSLAGIGAVLAMKYFES